MLSVEIVQSTQITARIALLHLTVITHHLRVNAPLATTVHSITLNVYNAILDYAKLVLDLQITASLATMKSEF